MRQVNTTTEMLFKHCTNLAKENYLYNLNRKEINEILFLVIKNKTPNYGQSFMLSFFNLKSPSLKCNTCTDRL